MKTVGADTVRILVSDLSWAKAETIIDVVVYNIKLLIASSFRTSDFLFLHKLTKGSKLDQRPLNN